MKNVLLASTAILFLFLGAPAQVYQPGGYSGIVKDQNGDVIAGAMVTVFNSSSRSVSTRT